MKNLLSVLLISIAFLSTAQADWKEGKLKNIALVSDTQIGLICEPAISQYTLLFKDTTLEDTEDDIEGGTNADDPQDVIGECNVTRNTRSEHWLSLPPLFLDMSN